jgi:uncharacterized protein YfdQ (DUF2303 family)
MTETKPTRSDAETILRFGAAIGVPRSPINSDLNVDISPSEGAPYVVLPEGYKAESLEKLLPEPIRHRANVVVTDSDSFIKYVKKHGSMAECCIYADIDAEAGRMGMVAVINDHSENIPGWRDHTCSFTPKVSVEWARWVGKNKVSMPQSEFATWLEENLADVAAVDGMPSGNDMLQLALGFERTAEKRLKSKINLQSGGVRLEYVDDENKDTRTSLSVFERFTIGLPVFEGSTSAYPLEARLKYREREGKVTFWFELIRPDRVFKTAVNEELSRINSATGFLMLNGKP